MPDYRKDWFARSELADPTIRIYMPDKDDDDNPPMDGLDAMRYELNASSSTSRVAGPAAGADPVGDARLLAIERDSRGRRYRDFKSAVNALSETEWPDWPVVGPRTLLWCRTFISQHFLHPDQLHARWMTNT